MDRKQTGKLGEDEAVKYLKKKRYKILARNWQNKWGEIDIVVKHKKKIIFCEVKTIKKKQGFLPEDQIDEKKKRQLVKMTQIYLSASKIPFDTPHQIDILAIEFSSGNVEIRHLENAIEDVY